MILPGCGSEEEAAEKLYQLVFIPALGVGVILEKMHVSSGPCSSSGR
jgi:hypothetical protein